MEPVVLELVAEVRDPPDHKPRHCARVTSVDEARRFHLTHLRFAVQLAHRDELCRVAEQLLAASDGAQAGCDRARHVHPELALPAGRCGGNNAAGASECVAQTLGLGSVADHVLDDGVRSATHLRPRFLLRSADRPDECRRLIRHHALRQHDLTDPDLVANPRRDSHEQHGARVIPTYLAMARAVAVAAPGFPAPPMQPSATV